MSKKATQFSIPVLGILGAILVVLKVLGMSSLSWGWTLAPFLIPLAISVVILLLALLVVALGSR